ncbi:hypothetical protein DM806_08995 [Sphingobium lactosutens]|uniref:hypothetical protein n=1 Tax=Sphingobium lactosutens TaxID=522773 RepID=UPI0015C03FE2|nr:hypothetical protein [Sphingobium lactosutens]NWK95810.1 hypothetical protein [Sphingobium lactosutens]
MREEATVGDIDLAIVRSEVPRFDDLDDRIEQWLAYPPEVARAFEPELTDLLGCRIHRPNLGNHEGRCPSRLLREPERKAGAIDAHAPDQHALIEALRADELPEPVTG